MIDYFSLILLILIEIKFSANPTSPGQKQIRYILQR